MQPAEIQQAAGIDNPSPAAASFWGARRAATFDHLNKLDANGEPCRSAYVLPGRAFGEAEALALARQLESNRSLEELYASGHVLSVAGAEALGAAIAHHPVLRVLCLGDGTFGADSTDGNPSEALMALVRQLQSNNSLAALDCEHKGIGPATLAAMLPHLIQHRRLAELKLGQNGFGCVGACALAQAARSAPVEAAPLGSIESLSVVSNNIRGAGSGEAEEARGSSSGAAALGDVLGMRGVLNSLDASSNPLGGTATAEQLKDKGNQAFGESDYDSAAASYVAAMHCSGDTSLRMTALSNRAEVALRTNRFGAAAYLARRALVLDPNHENTKSRLKRALECATASVTSQRTARSVKRLFDHFATNKECAGDGAGVIGRAELSELSVTTGAAPVDEEYWEETCEALGVEPASGLRLAELLKLYTDDGAWEDSLEADYTSVFGEAPGAQEDAEAQADQAVVTKEEEADEAAAEQAEEERCGVPDGFLSFCGVGHAAGGGLVASRITTLTLRECALTPKAVAMIAEAITRQSNPTITALYLDGNRAGPSGAAALAAALCGTTALRVLGLSMNAIGDDGGVALGKALQLQASLSTVSATGKATLVDLDVSKNQLDAAACSALLMPATELCRSTGTVVEARNGLRRLNLFGNRVGDEGGLAEMFALGALKSTTLASLDLGGNELGAASLLPICAAYKAASAECRLESLELFGNNHDENGVVAALSDVQQHLWEGAADRQAAGKAPCDIAWTALKDSAPPAPEPALEQAPSNAQGEAAAAREDRMARLGD